MRIDSIAALKRLPIGTKLFVVRSLLGPNRPTERTLRQVRSKDLVFEITDPEHKNRGQRSYLGLAGTSVRPTDKGFQLIDKDSGEVSVEYVFAEQPVASVAPDTAATLSGGLVAMRRAPVASSRSMSVAPSQQDDWGGLDLDPGELDYL